MRGRTGRFNEDEQVRPKALEAQNSLLGQPSIRHTYATRKRLGHVLGLLKLSFGILNSQRFLPRTGGWSNVEGTPMSQCP
jgi:hypothetical protein